MLVLGHEFQVKSACLQRERVMKWCASNILDSQNPWRFIFHYIRPNYSNTNTCMQIKLTFPMGAPNLAFYVGKITLCVCVEGPVRGSMCACHQVCYTLVHTHAHTYKHIHKCTQSNAHTITSWCVLKVQLLDSDFTIGLICSGSVWNF